MFKYFFDNSCSSCKSNYTYWHFSKFQIWFHISKTYSLPTLKQNIKSLSKFEFRVCNRRQVLFLNAVLTSVHECSANVAVTGSMSGVRRPRGLYATICASWESCGLIWYHRVRLFRVHVIFTDDTVNGIHTNIAQVNAQVLFFCDTCSFFLLVNGVTL